MDRISATPRRAWTEHTQPPVQQQPVQPQQAAGATGPPPSSPPQQWQQGAGGYYPQQQETKGGLNGRLLGIIGSATVDVTIEFDGQEQSQTFELVKDGDDWKIDAIS